MRIPEHGRLVRKRVRAAGQKGCPSPPRTKDLNTTEVIQRLHDSYQQLGSRKEPAERETFTHVSGPSLSAPFPRSRETIPLLTHYGTQDGLRVRRPE
jgi:hypothetical protein